mmetsp:Transcript_28364/g.39317  ORF Transcript_28364/g.39317 Transcript_28364/m.39317 type:complete len:146 (+) Transcript_28364:1-438(+)
MEWMANKILNIRLFSLTDSLENKVRDRSGSLKSGEASNESEIAVQETRPESGRWSKSVTAIAGDIMLVSQFTLCQQLKGHKPDFRKAMSSEKARDMFDSFAELVRKKYVPARVHTGAFGAFSHVSLCNEGPITVVLDSPKRSPHD